MITYLKKKGGVHDLLEQSGFSVHFRDNAPIVTRLADGVENDPADEVTVQGILDAHDELPEFKADKIAELKAEGLSRIKVIFPAIKAWDDLDLVREQWLSIAPAARQPTADFQSMIDIFQTGKDAATAINALTTEAEVLAYDVVNDPTWPV